MSVRIRWAIVALLAALLAATLALPAHATVPPPSGAVTGGHGTVRSLKVFHPTRPDWYGIVNWVDLIFGYNGTGDQDADAVKVSSQLQNGPGTIAHQTTVQRVGYDGRPDLNVNDCRPSKPKLNSNNGLSPCDPLGSRADYDPDTSISTAHSDWQGVHCTDPRIRGRIFGDFLFRDGTVVRFSRWSTYVDADTNGCPTPTPQADLEIDVQGQTLLQHNQTADLDVLVSNTTAAAGNVTVVINPADTLGVVSADSRCAVLTSTPDPNDYACQLGFFGTGDTANLDFDVRGTTLGAQDVRVFVNGTETTDDDTDTLTINVVASADLSLDKALASADTTPPAGSTVAYTFTVHNDGPDAATSVTVVDTWPGPLGTPTLVAGGDATGSLNASDELVLQFGSVAAGATESVTVTAVVDASTAPDTTIENVATVSGDQADPDAIQPGDRRDSVTVITTA